ncbi:hypothetical protein JXM67_15535 [candidate division WOR-3 bacterium]|nr:hypothetical protein [candidate division WOR-3 bacterium]
MKLIEIECPTCESLFEASHSLKLWDKIECPLCGERLQVVSLDPLAVDYYEEDDKEPEPEGDEEFEESADEVFEMETEYKPTFQVEDEENQSFELPEKSTLFENPEEEEEGGEEKEEED